MFVHFLLLSCLLSSVLPRENLPPDADLLIEGKSSTLPKECNIKTMNGDRISVHYTGYLYQNNKQFATSKKKRKSKPYKPAKPWVYGPPYKFTLGNGDVILGWDLGLLNMCVGEKRKLIIPSNYGYGMYGSKGGIPGNATLVFEVELIDIQTKGPTVTPTITQEESVKQL